MNSDIAGKIVIVTLLCTLFLAIGANKSSAQRIMLEKSQSYILDDYMRAFRVPITDSTGKIKYYDVTVKLKTNTDGSLNPNATVTAKRSPEVSTGVIPPGTYIGPDGTVCQATNMTLTNGRIQSFFTCSLKDDMEKVIRDFDFSLATGPVSDGHPFMDTLVGLGINTLSDVNTYTWGIATRELYNIAHCSAFSYDYNHAIGAKTNGHDLLLSIFRGNDLRCISTLTKTK